jgi:hypothetical protein
VPVRLITINRGGVGVTDFLELLANGGDGECVLEVLARGF